MKIDPKTLHEEAGTLMRDLQFIPETGAMCRGQHLRLWFQFRRIGRSRAGMIGIHTAPPVPDLHFRLTQACTDGGDDNVREAFTDATGSAVIEYLLGDLPCGAQVIPHAVTDSVLEAAGEAVPADIVVELPTDIAAKSVPIVNPVKDLRAAVTSGMQSLERKLEEILREALTKAAVLKSSLQDPLQGRPIFGLPVHAGGKDTRDLICDQVVDFEGDPVSIKIWHEGRNLRISALGTKKHIGRTVKIIIAEDKPEIAFHAYKDYATGRALISWEQAGLSPETVSKLRVDIVSAK